MLSVALVIDSSPDWFLRQRQHSGADPIRKI